MIRTLLLVGLLATIPPHGWGYEGGHGLSLRLSNSDLHRYPARTLFTPDGKLLVAFRIAQSKNESSTLQIAEFDWRTGKQIAEHAYAVPSAGPAKVSDGFVMAQDGNSLYYVELTGNPVVLKISTSTLEILSQSTSKLFDAADFVPRVESITDRALFLSAGSKLPGKAVHLVALDSNDVSKTTLDEQISARPGWGQSYKLSFTGNSLWMGSGKYWLKIGVKSGQIESRLTAQNDVHDWTISSSGLIGMTNLASAGYLQTFDETGHQLKTMDQSGCGFKSVELSPDERYGVAVCEKTGTTEWSFGKTLGREAVIFDRDTMTFIMSIPLATMSLKITSGTENERIWYPQPMIWNSGQHILIAVPDFSNTVSLQELMLPGHEPTR